MKTVFDNGSTRRIDWKWYGVGRMRAVYVGNLACKGTTYFINSYRRAPFHFRTFCVCGAFEKLDRFTPRTHLWFTGSRVAPYDSWHFRMHRHFIGGRTPKWFLRLREHLAVRKAVKEAQSGDSDYLLCSHCRKGVIVASNGYPGETIYSCSTCGIVDLATFDESEVI